MRILRLSLMSGGALCWSVALSGICLMYSPSVSAQNTASSETVLQSFSPDYFVQFNPNTASEMVARLPGFTLQDSDDDARGFGQASLNILINGRRPSSKSSGANEILERIPADTVIRIEILDGASLDIPGLSGQVANIVARSGTLSGSWDYAARFEEGTEPQLLEGGLNLSGKRGNLEFVLGIRADQFTFTENGPEQFFDASGNLVQDRFEDGEFQQQRPSADLNLTLNRPNGDVANLNLSTALRNNNIGLSETFDVLSTTPPVNLVAQGETRGDGAVDEWTYEIGGDYSTDTNLFGRPGRLKLISLHSYKDYDFTSVFQANIFGTPIQTTRFTRDDIETEYIGRGEYNWKDGAERDWVFALEGVFNKLESNTVFRLNDNTPDCVINPQDPNCAFVQVEEKRGQATLTNSWRVSDRINLQSSLGAEYSEIDVVTSPLPVESYFRPKGFLSASYTVSPRYTWRTKIERSVGQLDFDTFVSTVNLTEDFANAGNNKIVPEQTWSGEIELLRQDGEGISGSVRGFIDRIDDPIDRVFFADGTEGTGNLDSAIVYGLGLNVTWVMASVGLEGLRLTAEGEVSDSSIKDPLTGIKRAINSTRLWEYEVEIRYDIPKTSFALEAEIEQGRRSPFFRGDNIFETKFIRPEAEVSFIHKDLFGMQWAIGLQNIFDFRATRERQIFSPNRNGTLVQREFFDRQRGRRVFIKINDTF